MPRIRYLKPDFWKDEDIAELPYEMRLFYAGLWNHADKAGRLEDRPKRLKVEIFPYDNVDIDKFLEVLAKPKKHSLRPFIQRYSINSNSYIQILSWDEHQIPHHREQESKIPPAPPLTGMGMGTIMGMGREHLPSRVNKPRANTEQAQGKHRTTAEPTIYIATLTLKTSFIESKKQVYPMLDIEGEIRKCVDWHITKGVKVRNWDRAITNWLKIAYDRIGVIGDKHGAHKASDRSEPGKYSKLPQTIM